MNKTGNSFVGDGQTYLVLAKLANNRSNESDQIEPGRIEPCQRAFFASLILNTHNESQGNKELT